MESEDMKIRIKSVVSVSTEAIVAGEGGNEKFQQTPGFQEIQCVTDEPGELAQGVLLKGPFKFHAGQRLEISLLPSNQKE
jgi:hypothetical protein